MGSKKFTERSVEVSLWIIIYNAPKSHKDVLGLKRHWWGGMKKNVTDYVIKCLTCQQVKAKHQQPAGLHQNIYIPKWKWEGIIIDFVVGSPSLIRVIVDCLTKTAHFLLVRMKYLASQYA